MARIQGAPKSKASPMIKIAYRFGPKMMKKMAGCDPQRGSGSRWRFGPTSPR